MTLKIACKSNPHVPIIGGGAAASASPKIVLEKTGCDAVCIGEGEEIIADLCQNLFEQRDISHIQGIAYLSDGEVKKTAKRARLTDITSLPFPAYHLVDMETYIANDGKLNDTHYSQRHEKRIKDLNLDPVKARRPFHIFSKRGCPFGCNFCYRNFGKKVVYTSEDYTLEHMRFIEEKYNTNHFIFGDEIFNVKKQWVMNFCKRLVDEKRNYLLGTNNGLRANVMDDDIARAMTDAGFGSVGMGIESFYDPTLKAMSKGQKAEQLKAGLRTLRKYNLHFNSTQLLFGYETDGLKIERRSVMVSKATNTSESRFSRESRNGPSSEPEHSND